MPDDVPAGTTRIAPEDESGEPMRIVGTVRRDDGTPAAGVIVYAYHTNAEGVYPEGDTRHGRLRAWVTTDGEGHYRFDTIRPASYPDTSIPAHVHMHVIEPGRCTYWIDSIHFADDPLLPDGEQTDRGDARGGFAVVRPEKIDGVWVARRDIILGKNVPGYPE
jgi:protocatechuate 3,4-dioxygenase beta subunit